MRGDRECTGARRQESKKEEVATIASGRIADAINAVLKRLASWPNCTHASALATQPDQSAPGPKEQPLAQAPNIDGAMLQRSNWGSYPDNQIVRVRSQPKLSVLPVQSYVLR